MGYASGKYQIADARHVHVKKLTSSWQISRTAGQMRSVALTPLGPEYNLTVQAFAGAQKTAQASIAAGANLTKDQKLQLAIEVATPGLNTILTSKGVTADQETHVATWVQNIFNILAGPIAKVTKTITTAAQGSGTSN